MAFCPRCGGEVAQDHEFCPKCGWKLRKQCEGCGATVDGAAIFCPRCGRHLGGQLPPTPLPPAQPVEKKSAFDNLWPLLMFGIVLLLGSLLIPICAVPGIILIILWLILGLAG